MAFKRVNILFLIYFTFMSFILFGQSISASELMTNYTDIFGNVLGTIKIENENKLVIEYKYGLRQVDLYYCSKGEGCDMNNYSHISVMQSSEAEPYKNTSQELATYTYEFNLDEGFEYRVRVEAYFGTGSGYSGVETIPSYTISSKQVLDTNDYYLKGVQGNYHHESMNSLMSKIKNIINTIFLPIMYSLIGIVLVIKGAILGVQIVKSADNPDIRMEKIKSLKWLVIGVAVTALASSIVGVLTGFFSNAFN